MIVRDDSLLSPVSRWTRRAAAAWVASERKLAWLWLALLLAAFGTCHVLATLHHGAFGIDGGYYTAIAVKVRDGYGFKTNVSILHKGDVTFPAPTSVYPLWPLALGYLSRIFPLEALATWLPAALYMAALIFAYLWLHRTHPRAFFPKLLPGFQAAHVMVIVLGLSTFFTATLTPAVEALSYTLMFAAFWRFTKLWDAPSWRAGLEMGVWLGLVLLARPQLVVSAGVVFLLLGYAVLVCRSLRARYAQMLVTSVLAFVAVAAPWFMYTWSFAAGREHRASVGVCVGAPESHFEPARRLAPGFDPRRLAVGSSAGFPVAYAWKSKASYSTQYFTFHYAVLFTVPFALIAFVSRLVRTGVAPMRAWLTDPANLQRLYALGYGTAAFLALHVMHTTAWYFHRRHALGSVVFVVLMLSYLLSLRTSSRNSWASQSWRAVFGTVDSSSRATRRAPSNRSRGIRPPSPIGSNARRAWSLGSWSPRVIRR